MKKEYKVVLNKIADNLIGFTLKYRGRERYYPMYLSQKPFTDRTYLDVEFISEKIDEMIIKGHL